MEQVIIPPANAGTTGFMATDGGHHRHHDHGWSAADTSRFYTSQAEGVEAVTTRGVAAELATEKTGAAGVLATSVASGATNVAIEKTSAANQLATNVVGQQIQNMQLQNFNLAQVQAQTFFAATNLAIEKTAAAALIDSTKNAGAAALASAVTTAAIQAAIAACCCEQKELTRAEAGQTRDLINSLNSAALAVQLADAKIEVLALKLKPATTLTAV